MTVKDFDKIIDLVYMGGGFIPANQNATELEQNCVKGEVISFHEITARDLKFHRAYFALLTFIYGYMPASFKKSVPPKHFYRFIQHITGGYTTIVKFKDGSELNEYESIAFGRMSQKRFESYVKEQLPGIYENLIHRYFKDQIYDNIIQSIEDEFQSFLSKL
jgi:hypothetical protein